MWSKNSHVHKILHKHSHHDGLSYHRTSPLLCWKIINHRSNGANYSATKHNSLYDWGTDSNWNNICPAEWLTRYFLHIISNAMLLRFDFDPLLFILPTYSLILRSKREDSIWPWKQLSFDQYSTILLLFNFNSTQSSSSVPYSFMKSFSSSFLRGYNLVSSYAFTFNVFSPLSHTISMQLIHNQHIATERDILHFAEISTPRGAYQSRGKQRNSEFCPIPIIIFLSPFTLISLLQPTFLQIDTSQHPDHVSRYCY